MGARTVDLEARMDNTTNVLVSCDSKLVGAREVIEDLQLHVGNLENHAQRSKIRIRGIPETVEDLLGTLVLLLQELVPKVPLDRLEFDCIHRTLGPKKDTGSPRDIIAKMHFHKIKELIMLTARNTAPLTFQGHPYQIYADLAQSNTYEREVTKASSASPERSLYKITMRLPVQTVLLTSGPVVLHRLSGRS